MNTQREDVIDFRNRVEVIPGTDLPVNAVIDSARLIAEVEAFVTRYVILPSAARLPVALWAVATHLFDSFDCFPYLNLSSPTPRCGKTRMLEILELVCAHPWRGTAPTEAALFRFIELKRPTLLLDEIEGLSSRKASERDSAVLAILNAGYKKGQTVPRCVGNAHELQNFHVYCPKAFAAIGRLPSTLADRSIIIPMQRRAPGETIARFRFERAKGEAEPIRHKVEQIVKAVGGEIREAYAGLPELSFLSDRDEEIFAPLFSLCAVLAPGRIQELQHCAKKLSDGKAGDAADDTLPLRLLHDMRAVWPEAETNALTKQLLAALADLEESPWKSECELNPRKLARMLRGFEVCPRQVRTASGEGKGYILTELERAISRYPVPEKETCETTRINTA